MIDYSLESYRWDPYMMRSGASVASFWTEFSSIKKRKYLYIMGRGFDPRTSLGLKQLVENSGNAVIDVTEIRVQSGSRAVDQIEKLAQENSLKVRSLVNGRGIISQPVIQMWSPDRRRIGARSAADLFNDLKELGAYSDIIVDISALPRSVYFSILGKLYYLFEAASDSQLPNLHVYIAESPTVDNKVKVTGVDDNAQYLYGFVADLELESNADVPKLWIPILGESQSPQLERLHGLIAPSEICPLLPSPSLNPRRGDDLFTEYRTLLLDDWLVEPQNILYANEHNPFEAYRQIHQTVRYYDESLKPIRGCRTVLSALSSKLLSLSALLAACELNQKGYKVALADVPAQGYELDPGFEEIDDVELVLVSLLGECYAR